MKWNNLSRRGQMELIGLVVIVILITLGMLFMAQFALKSDPKKKIFVRKGLAYSTMGALMKTQANCSDYDLNGNKKTNEMLFIGKDLIDDCAEYKGDQESGFNCEKKHSCIFLNETISDLLNKTLGGWNKHYEFKSSLLYGSKPITLMHVKDLEGKGCSKERDSSGSFPLNTDAGIVENVLYLCD